MNSLHCFQITLCFVYNCHYDHFPECETVVNSYHTEPKSTKRKLRKGNFCKDGKDLNVPLFNVCVCVCVCAEVEMGRNV